MADILEYNNWQGTRKKISERCEYLLNSETWTDCEFAVGTDQNAKVFKAHKLIMGMSSPVFGAMFFGPMVGMDESILITDVQPTVFGTLLKYIYCDSFDLASVDEAFDLCYAAKKYKLADLVDKCSNYIGSNMSPEIACKSYEFSELIDEPNLRTSSIKMISERTDIVLADPSFNDIALGTWLAILDCENLKVDSECVLLEALHSWARKECQRKELNGTPGDLRSVIGPALQKIRFLSLSPQEFADGPAQSPLLKLEESHAIFLNFLSQNKQCPIPPGFATITQKRCSNFASKSKSSCSNQIEVSQNCSSQSSSTDATHEIKVKKNVPAHYATIGTGCGDALSVIPGEYCMLSIRAERSVLITGIKVEVTRVCLGTDLEFLSGGIYDSEDTQLTPFCEGKKFVASVNFLKFSNPVKTNTNQEYRIMLNISRYGGGLKHYTSLNHKIDRYFKYGQCYVSSNGEILPGTLIRSIVFVPDVNEIDLI